MSDPLCFEASTEARRIQNTNGPLNWPSNWALWKSNGCHHTDGEISRTTACFPPVRNMKNRHQMLVFMILLFDVTTTHTAQVNKSMKTSITEHERSFLWMETADSPLQTCFVGVLMGLLLFYNSCSTLLFKLVVWSPAKPHKHTRSQPYTVLFY